MKLVVKITDFYLKSNELNLSLQFANNFSNWNHIFLLENDYVRESHLKLVTDFQ